MVEFDLPEFDQWFPFKTLISHLQSALESIENLEYSPHINEIKSNLLRQKTEILSAYSSKSQQRLSLPDKIDKINVAGYSLTLTPEQIREVGILFRIFQLPDVESAIKLVLVSESQLSDGHMSFYPRGIIAVLHFYENMEFETSLLKMLLSAHFTATDELRQTNPIIDLISSTVEDLLESHGLFFKIINALTQINLEKILLNLDEERGLGDNRHKIKIIKHVNNTRKYLSESLGLITRNISEPLNTPDVKQFVKYISRMTELESYVSCQVVASFISYVDRVISDFSSLTTIESFHNALIDLQLPTNSDSHLDLLKTDLANRGLYSVMIFTWSVALRKYMLISSDTASPEIQEITDTDEQLLNHSLLDLNVLSIFHELLSDTEEFTEIFTDTVHQLFTDFICCQNIPLKEYRKIAITKSPLLGLNEETSDKDPRITIFPNFLSVLGDFYSKSTPEKLEALSNDYLCANLRSTSHVHHVLFEFVRQTGETAESHFFKEYCRFLTKLVTQDKALMIFRIATNLSGKISLSSVFTSLVQYSQNLKIIASNINSQTPQINDAELEALNAALDLIEKCASESDQVRSTIIDTANWQFFQTFSTLLQCQIPVDFKAKVFNVLTAVSKHNEATASHAIELLSTGNVWANVEEEFEKVESGLEQFAMTEAHLNFFLEFERGKKFIFNQSSSLENTLSILKLWPFSKFMRFATFLPAIASVSIVEIQDSKAFT